jgi:uncharacterized protein
LQADRGLAPEASREPSLPATYRYDPLNPTPNVGGAMFAFIGAGAVDNAPREKRADVLTYTSAARSEPLTLIGHTAVTLFIRSDNPHLDLFVRLCDVNTRGQSLNICDGLIRLYPETPRDSDGIMRVELKLHATAYTFQPGHSVRLQVSSGAHPRFARNSGTSVPIGDATQFAAANVEVFQDGEHPSRMVLPTYEVEAL